MSVVKSFDQIISGFQKTLNQCDALIEDRVKRNTNERIKREGLEQKIKASNDRVTENFKDITKAQRLKNKVNDFIN